MFEISITQEALDDIRFFRKGEQKRILEEIEEQLSHEPLKTTRNRKPLRENDLSAWELRLGDFRVFYDVTAEPAEVIVKTVGKKEHGTLFIRGKEYTL